MITMDTAALLLALGLAAALLLSMWLLWMLECEKELREQAEKDTEIWRSSESMLADEVRRLMAVFEAAYGMYSVLCAGGTLTAESPQAEAYGRASDAYWKGEVGGGHRVDRTPPD